MAHAVDPQARRELLARERPSNFRPPLDRVVDQWRCASAADVCVTWDLAGPWRSHDALTLTFGRLVAYRMG